MKNSKLNKKLFAITMAILIFSQTTVPVFASSYNKYKSSNDEVKYESLLANNLPDYKKSELLELKNELDLNYEEINFLEEQYLINHSGTELRWKVSAVKKVIKVAKPILKKAAKKFGVKMGEKGIADLTDYLFEWEDDLQNGIENFLINKWGWNKTAAHWTAKTIMFVAF
ncbi:hypothetical protein [Anaerococcus nagyae]|jgi:uncharacterized protein SPD_2303|uniref:DUF1002 domain-containing protein n=2 Tax=Anaerococcus nagyae TaxID=1755241 RepID=A0A3E2TG00_9FIRM|nr:hypothetical protein [Anaerococcus nagyae]RGB74915.1 hypothetical protein DXA39_07870 [Anaerococcus nagyae]